MRSVEHRVARALQRVLLVIAVLCLSWYGWRMVQIHRQQVKATAEVQRALDTAPNAPPGENTVPLTEAPPAAGSVIGELQIPRLQLSAPVKAGEDDSVLDFSVGYLPDTPLPWRSGNSAFAAHRDRLFRPLEHIHEGDEIDLSTTHGKLRYRVLKTLIVDPTDVWVVGPVPNIDLTLITCYPFTYVGHAPHRFIVQAQKI